MSQTRVVQNPASVAYGDGETRPLTLDPSGRLVVALHQPAGVAAVVRAASPLFQTVTIANGQSLSGNIDLPAAMFGIDMPATWTAADLTFQVSPDGVTFNDLYDETAAEVVVRAAAARSIRFSNPGQWLAIRTLRVRSGTAAAPVAQGGARTLTLCLVP